jgi:hypothetical protein
LRHTTANVRDSKSLFARMARSASSRAILCARVLLRWVGFAKADAYKLPDLLAVAAAGEKTTHDHPHAIPVIPITLPNSSLIK